MTIKSITIYNDGEECVIEVPARWEICRTCDGEGTMVNPAIDGNGITASEWAEWEEEERHMYCSGGYDIRCNECDGSGKRLVVNHEQFNSQQPKEYALWAESEREEADYRSICDSEAKWERRMLYGSDY